MRTYVAVASLLLALAAPASAQPTQPPNIIVLLADDLGYGDLGCYGHPTILTPELDRMAAEGMRFTQFYAAAPFCTPSRAALMTGRLPVRSGMAGSQNAVVLYAKATGGLPQSETTLATALKARGYATALVGKWHLGHAEPYRPLHHGFEHYYGLLYSNDMKPLVLYQDQKEIETPVKIATLTARYTEESMRFMKEAHSQGRPFFLYLAYAMPHIPLAASKKFLGTSRRGLYGDAVQEIDWSVGQILQMLRDTGMAKNTFVVFTSDNGPWLTQRLAGGSAGLLKGGKGSTWDGGIRMPTIAWWPGRVKADVVSAELGNLMDIFTTSLAFASVPLPSDRIIDGKDLTPVLTGTGSSPWQVMFHYRGEKLMAVRKGPWKMHVMTQAGYGQPRPDLHDPPLLYHMEHDPGEQFDMAARNPQVVEDLKRELKKFLAEVKPAKPQY
jgi:arylsulfatase A-like enzyme